MTKKNKSMTTMAAPEAKEEPVEMRSGWVGHQRPTTPPKTMTFMVDTIKSEPKTMTMVVHMSKPQPLTVTARIIESEPEPQKSKPAK